MGLELGVLDVGSGKVGERVTLVAEEKEGRIEREADQVKVVFMLVPVHPIFILGVF